MSYQRFIYFAFILYIEFISCFPITEEPINEVNVKQYNKNLYEGDIVIDENQRDGDLSVKNANIRALKWENGIIPFEIDSNSRYTSSELSTILLAMKKIETDTNGCLRFIPRTSEPYYITIRHTSTGCNSFVGRTNRAGQQVSLQKNGCISQDVVIHELLHVAGFEHEQKRPDRDNYINIIWDNIEVGAESQFSIFSSSVINTLNQPYDFDSIMHYRYDAFSRNGLPTITSKVKSVDTFKIGAKGFMSLIDIKKLKIFYGCPL